MPISRRRLTIAFGTIAAGLALAAFATPIVRDAIADRAHEAEWNARAAQVCPAAPAATSADSLASRPLTGHVFASHGFTRSVSILDLATGRVTTLPAGIADPHEVTVSPDGRWGVVADFGDYQGNHEFDGRRLAVFDLHARRLARIIDLGEYRGPHDLAFLPGSSSRLVVTAQTSRRVLEVDIAAGRVLGATETRGQGSHMLAVAADGRTAFTVNEADGSVSRLDLVARTLVAKHAVAAGPAEAIAVTPDGREVWVGHRSDGTVRVIDGATGRVIASLGGFVRPDRMHMGADGRFAVIADFGCRRLVVADVAARRILGPIAGLAGHRNPVGEVLPDGRTAVVALGPDGAVAMVDLEARRVIARHRIGRRLDGASWGPAPAR